jgi:acetyltransferase-like isoleucine patch superfamily enzyme
MRNKITFYWKLLLGLPKSLYINFYYFGFRGISLPILVTSRTYLKKVGGKVIINIPLRRGIVQIGYSSPAMSAGKQWNVWNVSGEIIFEGVADFGVGTSIFVAQKGKMKIGKNLIVTASAEIACLNRINIGEDVLLSWDILLMDSDSHIIRNKDNQIINPDKDILICNNVWVGARSIILKGTYLPENSVVGAGTITNKRFIKSNIIIVGNRTRIVKHNILWSHK